MGKKIMRKLVAVILASALVLTSGIGVFAAGSPAAGKVSGVTTVGTTTSLNVKWNKATNAKTYTIFLNGTAVKKGLTGTSCTITGLTAGKTYTVQVQAFNASGKSNGKSSVTAFTKTDGSAALAKRWLKKTSLKKATAGKKKATLTWKSVKGATKYQILQYKGGKWQVVKTVGKTTKTTVKGLKKGSKVKFRVRALNKSGYVGLWSAVKTTKKIK